MRQLRLLDQLWGPGGWAGEADFPTLAAMWEQGLGLGFSPPCSREEESLRRPHLPQDAKMPCSKSNFFPEMNFTK